MTKSIENCSSDGSLYNKIINETPLNHTVPQLPLLLNAFSNPNDITVLSSSKIFPISPKKPYVFSFQNPPFFSL